MTGKDANARFYDWFFQFNSATIDIFYARFISVGLVRAVHAGVLEMLTLHWETMTKPCTLQRNTWRSAKRCALLRNTQDTFVLQTCEEQVQNSFCTKMNLPLFGFLPDWRQRRGVDSSYECIRSPDSSGFELQHKCLHCFRK